MNFSDSMNDYSPLDALVRRHANAIALIFLFVFLILEMWQTQQLRTEVKRVDASLELFKKLLEYHLKVPFAT